MSLRKQLRRLEMEPLERRQMLDARALILTEFLADNERGLTDEDGDHSDWIELFNSGAEPVDLEGLILRDSSTDWTFPSRLLGPTESLVVFASGKDRVGSELHTNFRLSAEGESLALVQADGLSVIHAYDAYPFQTPDVSYGVEMSPGAIATLVPSVVDAKYLVPQDDRFALSWTEVGFDDTTWNDGSTGIGYETSGSNYAPYLNTRVPSGTLGFYTRIAFDLPSAAPISQLTLHARYDDGFIGYLNGHRVASGNGPANPTYNSASTSENSDGNAVVYEPFDISAYKQHLLPTGNILAIHSLNRNTTSSDLLIMAEIRYAHAGTINPETVGFFPTPSPHGLNGSPIAGFTAPVSLTLPHGFYDSPQTLTIEHPDPGVTIRYTTDGAAPTATTGSLYAGALTIDKTTVLRAAAFKDNLVPVEITTASYFFAADVPAQDRNYTLAAGFPSSWQGTSADYGMDPDVVGPNDDFGGRYANVIDDALTSVPTLSIVMDVDDMFGVNGIYSNPTNDSLEKAASLELVHPDGSEGFQIDAGIKIQGGAFRNFGLTKKKSFRFKFQRQYGPAKLEYPLFGPEATSSFDTLTLRMEANDGWQWSSGDNTNRLYVRDEFGRRTQLAMGQPAPHGTFGHVYINGVYWGTYNIVERPDESFSSEYIGGDKEDWDAQNSGRAINGDLQSWNELNRLAQQISRLPNGSEQQLDLWMQMQGLLPDGSKHPTAEDLLDVENYIDYLIVNFYGGNSDWPHKNYYAARQRGPESTGFKFFMWDSEWSLNLRSTVTTNNTSDTRGIASVYGQLRSVPEFQLWFADRVQKHFSPGGALYVDVDHPEWDPDHPERNLPAARFFELTNIMRTPLIGESARWGDQHNTTPHTVDESWEPHVAELLEDYFPHRSANLLTYLRRAGLVAAVDTPTFSQRGGVVSDGLVTLSAPRGQIYYTLDGSDPRLPGGQVSPQAYLYGETPVPITHDTYIRARTLDGSDWSAIDEAAFVQPDAVPADVTNLAITEIHYHPLPAQPGELDVDQDEFEFIEVTNIGNAPVNLEGVRFVEADVDGETQGIRFTFAQQALAPGASLVVVENLAAFTSRYGTDIPIAQGVDQPFDPIGEYGGKLSNGSERLTLLDAQGQTIRVVTYDDSFAEPTDGLGPSLEVIDASIVATEELSSARSWRASEVPGGTPGTFFVPVPGDFNQDRQVTREDVDLLYAALAAEETDATHDLNRDGIADHQDAIYLIEQIMGIAPGDADLNGVVDFADFLVLSANFGKLHQTWLTGDTDGDGTVQFSDFLLLSSQFGRTN